MKIRHRLTDFHGHWIEGHRTVRRPPRFAPPPNAANESERGRDQDGGAGRLFPQLGARRVSAEGSGLAEAAGRPQRFQLSRPHVAGPLTLAKGDDVPVGTDAADVPG
jgi:hypothetical protein